MMEKLFERHYQYLTEVPMAHFRQLMHVLLQLMTSRWLSQKRYLSGHLAACINNCCRKQ